MEAEHEVVSKEMAEHEFERFLDIWDIDAELKESSMETQDQFEKQRDRFIKELCSGNVSINDEGHVFYKLKYPKAEGSLTSLTFKAEKANKAIMDKFKEHELLKKTSAYVGTLTEQPPRTYLNLDSRDQKFPEVIVALFLG